MSALRTALVSLLLAGAAPAQTPPQAFPLDSVALEAKVREIAATLRCPVCLNLSIADSPSQLARDMREIVREHLKRGESEAQVRAFFEARYGDWVDMKPRARGFNLLVWLLPAVAVLGGGTLIVVAVRRWIRNAAGTREAADMGAPVTTEYLRKVQEELAKEDLD